MTWYSQAGQDEWVHSIVGDAGFFVDVGAYDGVEHSNTFALEQRGWTGVCIEPNVQVFGTLHTMRSVTAGGRSACVCAAMSDRTGDLRMTGDRIDGHGQTYVKSMRLDDLLERLNAPAIDYLSIDTEGHDLAVLQGMDFDRWTVRLITVEHNEYLEGPARKLAILDYLMARGFECVALDVVAPGYGCYESWYRRRDD